MTTDVLRLRVTHSVCFLVRVSVVLFIWMCGFFLIFFLIKKNNYCRVLDVSCVVELPEVAYTSLGVSNLGLPFTEIYKLKLYSEYLFVGLHFCRLESPYIPPDL